MWPHSTRSSQYGVIAPKPQDWPDFDAFEKSDSSLKIWLPQILIDRVNWISKNLEVSRPDIVRALAFENVYGRVAYEALIKHAATKQNTLAVPNNHDSIDQLLHSSVSFSRDRTTSHDLQHLGKSDEDLTITLPKRLKDDLTQLAKLHKLTASSYVRKLLVLHLLGELVHSQWQKALGKLPDDLRTLENEAE
jgi:hypothetical protein